MGKLLGKSGNGWGSRRLSSLCRRLLHAQTLHYIENLRRDLTLAGCGNLQHIRRRNDRHCVLLGIESDARLRHVIRDDGVESLLQQFLTSVLKDVVGLSGKSNYQLSLATLLQQGGDIVRRLEIERERIVLFHLLLLRRLRRVI